MLFVNPDVLPRKIKNDNDRKQFKNKVENVAFLKSSSTSHKSTSSSSTSHKT